MANLTHFYSQYIPRHLTCTIKDQHLEAEFIMSLTLSIQGWFYLLTGLWPVFSMKTFETVTGEKKDKWLVKTAGLLIAGSGIIFIFFNDTKAAMILAMMNAISLSAIDIFYVYRNVIPKIYLLDAIVEVAFVCIYLISMSL
jgi:hypothetical protein